MWNMSKWMKVNLPKDMVELIDRYLTTDMAKERGFVSRTDVVIAATRILLERDGMYKPRPRLEHLNTYEDHVKIVDNEMNRISSVYFKNGQAYCDLCDSNECLHIDYSYTIKDVLDALERHGYTIPKPKLKFRV